MARFKDLSIPTPCKEEVEKYIKRWNELENYVLQENSLDKLFFDLIPENRNIEDILIKSSTLNDFYSTHIFSIFSVANHILSLDIDDRLSKGDSTLVHDIADNTINGKKIRFYSFASKYCSHHKPYDFPIYDDYVDNILWYFKNKDHFADFKRKDLKDYIIFKEVLISFAKFYNIEEYNLKEIDRYIWQLGKEYFNKY